MKIMQVIPYFCFGGAEIMCENLVYAQRAQGHEIVVVSLYRDRTPIAARMEERGVRIEYLDKKLGLDLSMVPKLVKLMKAEGPDVVHTHLDVIKYAVAAAKLAGVKTCVHTVHNVAEKEAEGKLQKLVNGIYFRHGLSVPVALSPEIRSSASAFYGMDPGKIPVAYNGIDLSRCIPKTDYTLGDTVTILHIGRLNEQKNHTMLLRAFRRISSEDPRCRLKLLGDGELRQELQALAEELDISRKVEFCGAQTDVHPYLSAADIFVLPSLYEGIPMTIIEAMGTGLPIVATEVGGIPDMLKNETDALLIPCEEEALVEALRKLLAEERLRAKLGASARAHSVRFSAGTMAQVYCGIYQNH